MRTINELTMQERRVLALVTRGWRNAKIALELCISIRTVENHLYHIFDKLDVSSRTEAALLALQSGLLVNVEMSGSSQDQARRNPYAGSIS